MHLSFRRCRRWSYTIKQWEMALCCIYMLSMTFNQSLLWQQLSPWITSFFRFNGKGVNFWNVIMPPFDCFLLVSDHNRVTQFRTQSLVATVFNQYSQTVSQESLWCWGAGKRREQRSDNHANIDLRYLLPWLTSLFSCFHILKMICAAYSSAFVWRKHTCEAVTAVQWTSTAGCI